MEFPSQLVAQRVRRIHPTYLLEFDDGETMEVDQPHQSSGETRASGWPELGQWHFVGMLLGSFVIAGDNAKLKQQG